MSTDMLIRLDRMESMADLPLVLKLWLKVCPVAGFLCLAPLNFLLLSFRFSHLHLSSTYSEAFYPPFALQISARPHTAVTSLTYLYIAPNILTDSSPPIIPRVRRKRQRLPSSLSIESAPDHGFRLFRTFTCRSTSDSDLMTSGGSLQSKQALRIKPSILGRNTVLRGAT
jgi:hypothetical protein